MTAPVYHPTRAQFRSLAGDHAVVPVWREVLADLQTPLGVYDRLREPGSPSFLLESVEQGERWGRYSFIGRRPFLQLRASRAGVRLEAAAPAAVPEAAQRAAAGGDPLATLEVLLEALRAPQLEGLPPLFAGAVGYVGYDVVRFIERLPDTVDDDLGLDDLWLVFPGQLVAFDHLRQRLLVVSNVLVGDDAGADYDASVAASEELVADLAEPARAEPVPPPGRPEIGPVASNMTEQGYCAAVEAAKEHIRAGDVFQVVISQRFAAETSADAFTVYRVLRVINPSPYLYLFDYGDLQVVGSSPETLVTVQGRDATIWPIAGSRRRGADAGEDAALAEDLLADEKERAEHVMLVDLARNDLGRVCQLGTVRVAELMEVVRYSHIMHLVSKVHGVVRPDLGPVDVVRAAFPAGTLSGAPKVRAMEVIDELESTRRGVYGGGIGYFDLAGNVDLCIAIRTVVLQDGCAFVQAGGGIVADSVPEREYRETQDKAQALLTALRAAEALGATVAGGVR